MGSSGIMQRYKAKKGDQSLTTGNWSNLEAEAYMIYWFYKTKFPLREDYIRNVNSCMESDQRLDDNDLALGLFKNFMMDYMKIKDNSKNIKEIFASLASIVKNDNSIVDKWK